MKGIIAQIEGKYAVVLKQDGSFRKVRAKPHMETGTEIDMDQPSEKVRNTRFVMKVTSIAAAALLALGTGYGAYCYTVPYSYVHLDINPSIELTANIYDRIIKAEALNEDGRKLLEGRKLKHEKIDEGVSDLLGAAVQKGYLTENADQTEGTDGNTGEGKNTTEGTPGNTGNGSDAVLLTISSNSSKKSGILKKEILDTASKELDTDKVDSEILVGEASLEQRNEARELGVTPGKLALIEDAIDDEPELQLDELKKSSVKELLKKIQEKKNQEKANNDDKAAADGQSSQGRAGGNNSNNTNQTENTAFGNKGNGKGINSQSQPALQGAKGQETGTRSTGSSVGIKERLDSWINDQLKNQVQNNTGKQNNGQHNPQDSNQAGSRSKTGQQGNSNTQQQNNEKGRVTNKGEQTGIGTGSAIGNGSGKKIDEADRNTAGKNANELKKEREKLRDDLLNQMEKQVKERNNKLQQQKNTNADSNNKYGGKTNSNHNGNKK